MEPKFERPSPGEIEKEINDELLESENEFKKITTESVLFRDGKGNLTEIYNVANTYDPYEGGLDLWYVGGGGIESPNKPFEFMVQGETDGADDESDDRYNLFGYGGISFSVKR